MPFLKSDGLLRRLFRFFGRGFMWCWEHCLPNFLRRFFRWLRDQIGEWHAWFIGIRPWEKKYRCMEDWIYTGTWWVNHWIYYSFIVTIVQSICPWFLKGGTPLEFWLTILVPHPVILQEVIPAVVTATTAFYIILNQVDKYQGEPDIERWRRGGWFPVIWACMLITCWILQFLGHIEPAHAVTVALAEIVTYNLFLRFVSGLIKKRIHKKRYLVEFPDM